MCLDSISFVEVLKHLHQVIHFLCGSPEKNVMSRGHCEMYSREKEELLLAMLSEERLEKYEVLPLCVTLLF